MKVYMVRSDYGPDGDWSIVGLYRTEAAANEYLALDKAANGYTWNQIEEIEVEESVSQEDRDRIKKEGIAARPRPPFDMKLARARIVDLWDRDLRD